MRQCNPLLCLKVVVPRNGVHQLIPEGPRCGHENDVPQGKKKKSPAMFAEEKRKSDIYTSWSCLGTGLSSQKQYLIDTDVEPGSVICAYRIDRLVKGKVSIRSKVWANFFSLIKLDV